MPTAALLAHLHGEVGTARRLRHKIVLVGTTLLDGSLLGHAIVRIVPVVSLLLNFTENVSPFARVSAEP